MKGEQILDQMDETLDRLICNAVAIEKSDWDSLSDVEIDAFQKTQESLLHRFLHMNNLYAKEVNSEKMKKKITQFSRLKQSVQKQLQLRQQKISLILKRRKKGL